GRGTAAVDCYVSSLETHRMTRFKPQYRILRLALGLLSQRWISTVPACLLRCLAQD
ncbi:hypothetical protein CRM22_005040, partial [Opisthorchis felineus]